MQGEYISTVIEAPILQVQMITYVIYHSTKVMLTYFQSISLGSIWFKNIQCSYIFYSEFSLMSGNNLVSDLTVYHCLNQQISVGNWWPKFATPRYGSTGSTLYSESSLFLRFFRPKPFEVAMLRRTCGPKVLYSEVHLARRLCSEDSKFRKALHYMDSMLRRFFSPKFTQSEVYYAPKIPYSENRPSTIQVLYYEGCLVRSSSI